MADRFGRGLVFRIGIALVDDVADETGAPGHPGADLVKLLAVVDDGGTGAVRRTFMAPEVMAGGPKRLLPVADAHCVP